MKIWVDSKHGAPDSSYVHCISVNDAISAIKVAESEHKPIKVVDLGRIVDEKSGGCDKRLDVLYWLQDSGREYTVRFHSEREVSTV